MATMNAVVEPTHHPWICRDTCSVGCFVWIGVFAPLIFLACSMGPPLDRQCHQSEATKLDQFWLPQVALDYLGPLFLFTWLYFVSVCGLKVEAIPLSAVTGAFLSWLAVAVTGDTNFMSDIGSLLSCSFFYLGVFAKRQEPASKQRSTHKTHVTGNKVIRILGPICHAKRWPRAKFSGLNLCHYIHH